MINPRLWKKVALTISVIPALLVSCKEAAPEGTAGIPSVTIEEVSVASDAITFSLVATDADEVVYMVRASGGSLTVEDLIADGESLLYLEPITRRYTQLSPDRTYTVYAVALRAGEHGEMASLEMTTEALPPLKYDDELTARAARLTYWGPSSTAGIDEFTLTLSDAAGGIDQDGSLTHAPGSFNARLVLWSSPADPQSVRLADGTYYYTVSDSPAAETIDGNASAVIIYDESGNQSMSSSYISDGSYVEVSGDGDSYSISASIVFGASSGEETVYKIDWNGPIDTVIGEDDDDRSVILDSDILDKEFVDASAIYQGISGGYDLVRLEFTDIESAFDLSSIPNLAYLSLDVYTAVTDDDRLSGTVFNVAASAGRDIVRQGSFDGTAQSLERSYIVLTDDDGVICDADGIKSGTMTRTLSPDGTETYAFDFVTTHDHRITGSFEGTVTVLGYERSYESNLTGDYRFAWGDGIYANNLYNRGDEAGTGNTKWQVELWLESGDGTMDCFYADLYSEGTDDTTLPAETYSAASSVGAAWTFTPGTYDGYGSYTYWYRTDTDSYTEILWAPFVDGTITVSGGTDGSDYTFVFDLADDAGHKVTGSWTGPLD